MDLIGFETNWLTMLFIPSSVTIHLNEMILVKVNQFAKTNDWISRIPCYVFVCGLLRASIGINRCYDVTAITNCKRFCSIWSYLLLVKRHNKCIRFVFVLIALHIKRFLNYFDYDSVRPDSVVIKRTKLNDLMILFWFQMVYQAPIE